MFYLGLFSIIALIGVYWLVRRILLEWMKGDSGAQMTDFTLADLRRLHASGQITDAEFERARAKVLGKAVTAANGTSKPTAPPPDKTVPPDSGAAYK